MAIARPEAHRSPDYGQHHETDEPELTLADIEADTGKGPAPDLEGGVFHASTEDFIAAMRARRRQAAQ